MPGFSAILVAAGSGLRLASVTGGRAKQFLELAGRPIYLWSLAALSQAKEIDRIVIVVPEDAVERVQDEANRYLPGKMILATAGGTTRQKSVWKGIEVLDAAKPDFVLVHDAARPFVTQAILDNIIYSVIENGACTAIISATDTIKQTDGGALSQTLDRNTLVQVQTPQAARFEWLKQAHEEAGKHGRSTTDDATLLEACGRKISTVQGSTLNFKITEPDDLIMAEALAVSLIKGLP